MRTRLAILIGVLATTIVPATIAPTSALAASGRDASATHKALQAAYTALHAIVSTWPTEEASFRKLDNQIAAECPGVGAGLPQNETEQRLSYEVAGALWATAYKTDAKIAQTAIRAVSGLRWSNSALTGRVHGYLKGLNEMIALPVPDLCTDLRTWASGGHQAAPSNVVSFDEHVEAIDVEIPEPKLFERYVQPADAGLLVKVRHLAVKFEELEFIVGQREWNRLLGVLDLPQ
ncbi:MAG TPA: hypothetical protein VMG80_02980 [Solirubrobacteraceae bacterium]|nr:hypothetical protein [Solirubrobacteraceae bacterium]